jgi:bifunctional UDP-N-acetylglucosamine pyrophosphorylase / glucosamine-1-phosphate N-acetyltransferase
MSHLHIVILAAGKGTRMKSARPKVLHHLAGLPLIEHVLRTADELGAAETVLVVGHGADEVQEALSGRASLQYVLQSPQLGTGHAMLQTERILKDQRGTALLLYADVPLLQAGTLHRLLDHHRETKASATVLTTVVPDPQGYGRIVRDDQGAIERIVEERDASGEERAIAEINSGIYALELGPLFDALHSLAADNAQGEYYLTDLVAVYRRAGRIVETLCADDAAELRGVNNRIDLAELSAVIFDRKRRTLMLGGVTLEDPATTFVEPDVAIGADTILGPGVTLTGRTTIGERCRIHAGCRLTDARLDTDVTVLDHSVITSSTVRSRASVGPFAHLRPGSDVAEDARVGNFVELKKTRLGPRSKAGHLAYLGDATIGADVNIGAGTITCNYDGERKHQTTIEDGVFVGSDSQLVAPVTIGRNAYVGAGSSITEDVPPDSLAIARARQTNKGGWAASRHKTRPKESL